MDMSLNNLREMVKNREAWHAAAHGVAKSYKNLPAMWETWVQSLGQEEPLEKEMAPHSSILAWEILPTEEPGGLQSMGSQRVEHDLGTKQQQ